MNIKVINSYRSYLYSQKENISTANRRVGEEIRIAEITYKAVSLSKDIAMMIRNGVQILDIVSGMDIPPLAEFKNQELKGEFVRLTQRMMQQIAQR